VIHCGRDIGTDWEDVIDQLKAMYKTRQDVTDEEIEMAKQKA